MTLFNERYILALDPSGSFNEGKGTTGWCLYDNQTKCIAKFGFIYADNFKNQFEYWDKHLKLIDSLAGYHPNVVIEDYLLYGDRASNQINSRLETPQLIGIIKYECWKRGLKICTQTAMQVKTRWTDDILINKQLIVKRGQYSYINGTKISDHVKDSVRHAIHFATYTSNFDRR